MRYRNWAVYLLIFAVTWAALDHVAPLGAASRRPPPNLGAFLAPVTATGTIPGTTTTFTWVGTVTLAPSGSETRRTISGTGVFTIGGVPPPPPPPPPPPVAPTVTGVSPNPVDGGAAFVVTGTGFDTSTVVTWSGMKAVLQSLTPTALTVIAPVVSASTSGPLVVTTGAGSASGPALTVRVVIQPPPPPPPPPSQIDVRTRGVKGDGTTIDRTVLNALVQNAPAGSTLYFRSGTYLVDDAIKVYRNDLAFLGEGDTSIIKSVQGSYHFQIGHGGPVTGISFKKLQLYGTPGAYMADGTSRGGVLNFGGKGVVFEDMLFTACAEPILNAGAVGGTYGTVLKNSRVLSWGRMAYFANGGDRVSNCKFIQDDPNLYGERSSHAFYIHSGSRDVEIADTEISGARKYSLQLYGENDPNPIEDVRLLRLNIHDAANGIILAHGAATAGVVRNALIEGCTIRNTYGGSAIAIKNGEGVIVRGNVIDGGISSGAYLGVWAPYEPGFSLKDIQVTGNIITHCDRGIFTLPSNGGSFSNVQISGNRVSGNRKDYDITGPGVVWAPGQAPSASKTGATLDTRPSDDRSAAAKLLQ